MCECSGAQADSKPRASSACPNTAGAVEYSVKNIAAPKSIRSSRYGAEAPPPDLCEAHSDRLGPFAAFGDVDQHTLTFIEGGDARALQDRGVHERVLAAFVAHDEPEALLSIEPFHGSCFLDAGLRQRHPRCGRIGRAPRRGLGRGAAVDADNFGHLRTLLARSHPDLQSLPRLHGSDAVAFENAGVEEGVSRAVGELDKPETPFGLEPFHDGAHRRSGRRLKSRRLTEAR